MKVETDSLIWQIIVFVLGFFLILTVREYLFDKNEIEAETARVNCILKFKALGETEFEDCKNIATYKSGEKGMY